MTTVRGQLALASFGFAGLLWWHPNTFERPGFRRMAEVASADVWAWCFLSHGVLAVWRLWDSVPRPYCLAVVNVWGFLVWFVSTVLIYLAVGELTPGIAVEITILLNAVAAICRGGLNDDKVGP
jgi:hypothetical protein